MDNQIPTPTPTTDSNGVPIDPTPGLPTSPLGQPPTSSDTPPSVSSPQQPIYAPLTTETDQSTNGTGSALSAIARGFSTLFGAVFSWIIFPIAVVLILHNFVFQAYHVIGTSMVPSLHDADYLIVSKLGYTQALIERAFGQDKKYIPARGEVIVFRFPKDTTRVFVKRVIGLPGDRVVVKNGGVTVYNKAHPDGFNPDVKYEATETTTLVDTDEIVQTGNIFVMGDNRSPNGSYDSREWGELPSSYIIGNAVLRLLPLDQIKTL